MTEDPSEQAAVAAPNKADQTRVVGVAVGVLFCLAVAVALVLSTGGSSSGTDRQAASTTATAAAAVPATPSIRDTYGTLRRDATIACRAGQWAKCKADLEEAARLDPGGDKVLPVQRMHAMLVEAGVE